MNKPTVQKAKQICRAKGYRSKVITKRSLRTGKKHTYVKPLGASESFINTLIDMGIFTFNKMIKCQ